MDRAGEYSATANELVNGVIKDAMKSLETRFIQQAGLEDDDSGGLAGMRKEKSVLLKDTSDSVKNITWMTIAQFGRELAEQKIDEFIKKTWQYEDSWLYCIDYLGDEDDKYDARYKFRVRWSLPTRRKPIPRATASVYFTFSVSKIKPGSYPVEVYYVFETNSSVHRPGQSIFREKWLKDIIDSKIIAMAPIDF